MSTNDDWPWPRDPRRSPFELDGAALAVEFGLADTVDAVRDITAMICAGFPENLQCRAAWVREGALGLVLKVSSGENEFRQRFERQGEALSVTQQFWELEASYHRKGHGRRLARNLVYLYDDLNVRHVSTEANYMNGGYTWAVLGCIPNHVNDERVALLARVQHLVDEGDIHPDDQGDLAKIIKTTSREMLMRKVASLRDEDGRRIGELILVSHRWHGHWDLHNDIVRANLRDALQ